MYALGTLKLTWINPNDYALLESKMFDKGALETLRKYISEKNIKNYMVFELVNNKNDEYQWRLLPYGKAESFLFHMRAQDSPVAWGIFLTVLGFSIYGMYVAYKKLN